MTISSPEQTVTAVDVLHPRSVRDALEHARAYKQMAGFLDANPDLAERADFYSGGAFLASVTLEKDPAGIIADAARRGREAGARVEEHISDKFGGARIYFGQTYLQVYASVDQVCRRVVVGMVEDVQYALIVDLDGNPRKDAEQAAEVSA